MKIKILTLFPNMLEGILKESILKRAIEKGVCSVELIDMRQYSLDKHHHVDDTPYGGGAGMVLACDVVDRAIIAHRTAQSFKILMTPQGRPFQQTIAKELASKEELILICGHYEGFDERIRSYVDDEISIGDYVLTGGEIPAMVLIDSISRYVDGVLSNESTDEESFSNGLLEYPQYTRPEIFNEVKVPEVLISGHHENIRKWRREKSLENTFKKRPELLENVVLTRNEKDYIENLKKEVHE